MTALLELSGLRKEYRRSWLARNRPSGWSEMQPMHCALQALLVGSGASWRPRKKFCAARQPYSSAQRSSWRATRFSGSSSRRSATPRRTRAREKRHGS